MRKTLKIIKKIILKKEKSPNQEDEDLRFCDFYKKGKPMRHVRRKAESRNLKIFDKIHIDVVIIIFQNIKKKVYYCIYRKSNFSTMSLFLSFKKWRIRCTDQGLKNNKNTVRSSH